MKITNVTMFKVYTVDTDAEQDPTYKRDQDGHWEQLWGDSWWEPLKGQQRKEIESLFQAYLAAQKAEP